MILIMVEWLNGAIEEVDSTDDERDVKYLIGEYRSAFYGSYRRIWSKNKRR